jgi:hypothetical protein
VDRLRIGCRVDRRLGSFRPSMIEARVRNGNLRFRGFGSTNHDGAWGLFKETQIDKMGVPRAPGRVVEPILEHVLMFSWGTADRETLHPTLKGFLSDWRPLNSKLSSGHASESSDYRLGLVGESSRARHRRRQ